MKNRNKNWMIVSVLIIVSIIVGVNISFGQIEAVAISALEKERYGVLLKEDLDNIGGTGQNLVAVAKRYLPSDHQNIKILHTAAQSIGEEKGNIREKYANFQLIKETSREILSALQEKELSDWDREYVAGYEAILLSYENMLQYYTYNEKAKDYNKALMKFPANVLKYVTFYKPLPVF